jgi:hypothetical protein
MQSYPTDEDALLSVRGVFNSDRIQLSFLFDFTGFVLSRFEMKIV